MTNWYHYDLENYINKELELLKLKMDKQILTNNSNYKPQNTDNILKQLNNLIGLKTLK